MEQIEFWKEWFRRASTLISGLAALAVEHSFHEDLDSHSGYAWLAAILVFLLLLEATEVVFEKAVNIVWIRRMILGRHWVEGTWFDVVIDKEIKIIINTGIICIDAKDGQLYIRGSVYSPHGRRIGAFESVAVVCNGGKLQFMYQRSGSDKYTPEYGYAEYTFTIPVKGRPTTYTGEFYDAEGARRLHTEAMKEGKMASVLQGDDQEAIKAELTRRVKAYSKKGIAIPD